MDSVQGAHTRALPCTEVPPVIEHRPFGIDDPYKRLATERHPRDPVAGDAPQIGFRTALSATEAWVMLERGGAPERLPALPLAAGLWTALLPALGGGAYAYTIHATDGAVEQASPRFGLDVARRRRADRVAGARVDDHGLTVDLAGDDGARATLRLGVSGSGVARIELRPGGVPAGTAADDTTGAVPARDPQPPLACTVTEDPDGWTLRAEGLEVRLDAATLALTATRPGRPAATVRTTVAANWTEAADGRILRHRLDVLPDRDEPLYGLGERFAGPGLRGHAWDVRVYEEYKEQGRRTYLPVPFFLSPRGWGGWVETDAPARVDARGAAVALDVEAAPRAGDALVVHLIVAAAPYDVTAAFVALTGAIALPPRWAFGPWMSANTWNDQATAMAAVRRTLAEGVPATVLVLEAWSDEATFYAFNDAEYDAVPGEGRLGLADMRFGGRWPDPKGMVDECHANGVRVVLWQIPVLRTLPAPHAQHDADVAHAIEHGYVIRHGDGTPYRNAGWWFTDALVFDPTNPDARAWWFDKRRYLFDDLGIDGMKTDGGEHLWGRDLVAWNGQRGTELVNRYAQAYVDAYHAFVTEATGGDGLTFSRAGYVGAQRTPAHWAGDENSTWSAFRASIQAGLSAGMVGLSIWGWDIAGFSGEIPTVEFYLRSTQMACFCPVMQYHSELHQASECRDRTPWNVAERHGDPRALTIYRAYARLRMRLLDHVADEAEALAAVGQPLMRMPALVWPEAHDALLEDPDSYLFGRDLLVCPVLEKGAETRSVRLPPGDWVDLWSGAAFTGDRWLVAPAPLARIPVFVRADAPRLDDLLAAARGFEAT
jgi:alpha-glucosidase (family GH31 glycosyl hydrolase)